MALVFYFHLHRRLTGKQIPLEYRGSIVPNYWKKVESEFYSVEIVDCRVCVTVN